jgi:hypothetical protein
MVELGTLSTESGEATPEWRLAAGVWPVEGIAFGAPAADAAHVYTLVRPDGRRFQLSEPLYRLAELLEQRLPLATIAVRLSERLGRSLEPSDVASLIERKLVPWGVVAPR